MVGFSVQPHADINLIQGPRMETELLTRWEKAHSVCLTYPAISTSFTKEGGHERHIRPPRERFSSLTPTRSAGLPIHRPADLTHYS